MLSPLLMLLTIFGQGTNSAPVTAGYAALVSAVPCAADKDTPPKVYLLTERVSPMTQVGAPLAVRSRMIDGVYLLEFRLSHRHNDLYVKSEHCGMGLTADYLAAGTRAFSVSLEQGYEGDLENYGLDIVGTLPLEFVRAVTLFPLWIPGARINGSVDGKAFYFVNLRPGRYLFRVELSSDQYAEFPMDFTKAPWHGVVRVDVPLDKLHFN